MVAAASLARQCPILVKHRHHHHHHPKTQYPQCVVRKHTTCRLEVAAAGLLLTSLTVSQMNQGWATSGAFGWKKYNALWIYPALLEVDVVVVFDFAKPLAWNEDF